MPESGNSNRSIKHAWKHWKLYSTVPLKRHRNRRAELSRREGCVTVCGILHHRSLHAGRHLPCHRNTGWAWRKGRKRAASDIPSFNPSDLPYSVLTIPLTWMDQLGPKEAVYQDFDPVVAIQIIPSCWIGPCFPSNPFLLENRPDPVATWTPRLRHPPCRLEQGRQQSAHKWLMAATLTLNWGGGQAEGSSEGGPREIRRPLSYKAAVD